MATYITVRKLYLFSKELLNSSAGIFARMSGMNPKTLENLPEEETVVINTDKILGIS